MALQQDYCSLNEARGETQVIQSIKYVDESELSLGYAFLIPKELE